MSTFLKVIFGIHELVADRREPLLDAYILQWIFSINAPVIKNLYGMRVKNRNSVDLTLD